MYLYQQRNGLKPDKKHYIYSWKAVFLGRWYKTSRPSPPPLQIRVIRIKEMLGGLVDRIRGHFIYFSFHFRGNFSSFISLSCIPKNLVFQHITKSKKGVEKRCRKLFAGQKLTLTWCIKRNKLVKGGIFLSFFSI